MGLTLIFSRVFFPMFLCLPLLAKAQDQVKVFDVTKYGAVADGHKDNEKSFWRAWNDACQWEGKASVYIPTGTFFLGSVTFTGPCKNLMLFMVKGVLKAPSTLSLMNSDRWIAFRYVNGLVVTGGGTLDGQGASGWSSNSCQKNPSCKDLPVSMRFEFVSNARVNHITSVDSKTTHFLMFGCSNIDVSNVRISAPGDSPNTDGIKIGNSNQIRITRTRIGTGDDCISLVSGSSNINISDVFCGPGHGISIGSLGRYPNEKNVVGVTVNNCTFSGTTNGVRIKTWGSYLANVASGFTYENIFMNNVQNPIIIDQQYCPNGHCKQVPSHVQVKDVTYRNIWGLSKTKVAINFQCSRSFPCRNIMIKDINLSHHGPEGAPSSLCSYVNGVSYGRQSPPSCI